MRVANNERSLPFALRFHPLLLQFTVLDDFSYDIFCSATKDIPKELHKSISWSDGLPLNHYDVNLAVHPEREKPIFIKCIHSVTHNPCKTVLGVDGHAE